MSSTLRHMVILLSMLCASCMEWEYHTEEEFNIGTNGGLFICNEGNFQYGNATLSYYNPTTKVIENEIFYRANSMRLGDVAQSMTIHNNKGWVVVNNSHVIFAIDLNTFREVGRITGFTSPRYIHFVSDDKAYVTQIWDNRIFIVNPKRYEVTGYIECPMMSMEQGSTEQMVQLGDYLYVSFWSYQNRILKIDTSTDSIVGSVEVGIQPSSLLVDCNNKLWTITDGGYKNSPYGSEQAALYRIDPDSFSIEARFDFAAGASPSELQLNGTQNQLFWIDDHVWAMDIDAEDLPEHPLLNSRGTTYYGLSIDPYCGDIYVADAIDYQQQGKIYRYTEYGELIDEFYAGIIPGSFCWKQ